MATVVNMRRPRRVSAILWFAFSGLLAVLGFALCITLVGILPGLGLGALSLVALIYGQAALRGEPLRGALGRRRLRNGPDWR